MNKILVSIICLSLSTTFTAGTPTKAQSKAHLKSTDSSSNPLKGHVDVEQKRITRALGARIENFGSPSTGTSHTATLNQNDFNLNAESEANIPALSGINYGASAPSSHSLNTNVHKQGNPQPSVTLQNSAEVNQYQQHSNDIDDSGWTEEQLKAERERNQSQRVIVRLSCYNEAPELNQTFCLSCHVLSLQKSRLHGAPNSQRR